MVRSYRVLLVLGAGLAFLAAGGLAWLLTRRPERPTPPDIHAAGGVILVYEIDRPEGKPDLGSLARQLRERIDPDGSRLITVRPGGKDRVEILVPAREGFHPESARRDWEELIRKVRRDWSRKLHVPADFFDVRMGQVAELAERIHGRLEEQKWPPLLAGKEAWARLTRVAENWQVPREVIRKVRPGDYRALADRLHKYRQAVHEIHETARREAWREALSRLRQKFPGAGKLNPDEFDPDDRGALAENLPAKGPSAREAEAFLDETFGPSLNAVLASIKTHYRPDASWKALTDQVRRINQLISRSGKLEFLILANDVDDRAGAEAAGQQIKVLGKGNLDEFAKQGKAPPGPVGPDGRPQVFTLKTVHGTSEVTYSWVELSTRYRDQLELSNRFAGAGLGNWATVAAARDKNEVARIPDSRGRSPNGYLYVYSRDCKDRNLTEEQRKEKKYDYFILVRDPEIIDGAPQAVTGSYLASVYREEFTANMRPAVGFRLNAAGARRFLGLTRKNTPSEEAQGAPFYRHLAIVLDRQVMTAPTINSEIEDRGQITGDFTAEEVDALVNILRSGTLPVTFRPQPVRTVIIQPEAGKGKEAR